MLLRQFLAFMILILTKEAIISCMLGDLTDVIIIIALKWVYFITNLCWEQS